MNPNTRSPLWAFPLITAGFICAWVLTGVSLVQASPDPPASITNGVALLQGNQGDGITSGIGGDFQPADVTTLDVNSLTGAIQPANGVSGINFQKTGAGDVTINAGMAGSNIIINTTAAAGILAGSVGSPPANPPPDAFWGVPIPASSSAQGGVVQVFSYSDITNRGDNAAGILTTSQTTGYSQTIIQGLTNLVNAGVTFTVVGATNADGTNVALGGPITGTLVDTNGANVLGAGGSFMLNTNNWTFSFDAETNLSGLAVGESYQSTLNYTVQGVNKSGVTIDSMGTLLAVITMTTNGLVTNCGAYFDAYGPSTNQNSLLPDIGSYGQALAANASAGGAGNSVTVDNEGSIKTYGTNSSAIFAQSLGGNGGAGRGGSISHSAGQGGAGSNGGKVTVTANGSITTISNYSCGVVAWSQGGNGGPGGNGGTWRYGARGGTGGNAGEVDVVGNGAIRTYGDNAIGILAVSVGGDGGNGGSGGGVTGGGNGGFGGHGSNVVVNGNWNITTEGDNAFGIWVKSVGGNAGTGGSGGWLAGAPGSGGIATDGGTVTVNSGGTIETFGSNSYGIYAESVGGFGGQGGSQSGIFYSHGGSGESAGSGGDVSVTQETSGQMITHGTNSHGILAQSIGGGGGSGGSGGALVGYGGNSANGGFGGNVNVTNFGSITTFGGAAKGIYAQSVGGGGGDGGFGAGAGAVGGKGSGTSDGGKVKVFNTGTIDSQAEAIFAQSIGGGGGNGGSSSGWFSFGGSGGGGGNADSVTVINTGNLTNHEDNASAIFAQSLGGGGGNGGCSVSAGAFGSLAVGGSGGKGGSGAEVSVSSGTNSIDTEGDSSHGIFAQSVGGGGGNGGYAIAASIGSGVSIAVAVGGNGGSGGSSSNVVVNSSSVITTRGTGSHGIFAQSVGGGGGTGGFNLALSGSDGASLSLGIGGSGGGGGNGQEVTLGNSGGIETFGDRSYGILAQSVGGGGGDGGFSISVAGSLGGLALPLSFGGKGGTGGAGGLVFLTNSATIITHSNEAHGIMAQSVGGGGGSGGFSIAGAISTGNALSLSFGGSGGSGGAASNLTLVNSGTIATLGDRSYGVLAQSVGGGGGDGGFGISGGITGGSSIGFSMGGNGTGGGRGGNVYLENSGNIFTVGDDSHALIAQSIGGGGGNGGFAVAGGISAAPTVQIGIGGKGGSGANGGAVTLISGGPTNHTEGDRAYGIFAQSVGGGGGNGGFAVAGGITREAAVSFAMGGNGSTGGMGGSVIVANSSRIETEGDLAHGILAQSVGGGGGAGGFSMAGSLALSQESKQISVAIGGDGGGGGSGSNVMVYNSGTIGTLGERANGIFAQSVGGGGGDGGEAKVMNKSLGMVFTNSGSAGTNDKGWSLSIAVGAGGNGGSAGNGGVVTVSNLGDIYTGGSNSIGIMAQSVGGGGGSGGLSATDASGGGGNTSVKLNFGLGGKGGDGGAANIVTVTNQGTIVTVGDASHGIFVQSVGGGGGLGGASTVETSSPDSDTAHSVTLSAAIGGAGGAGGNGSNVVVQQNGIITTYGEGAYGILAQSVGGGGGMGGTAKIQTEQDTNDTTQSVLQTATPSGNSTNKEEKTWSVNLSFGLGGSGGIAGDGGQVTVDNRGSITNYGANSIGIFAQSVGGGGGAGGMSQIENTADGKNTNLSLSISLGGSVGGGGGAGGSGSVVRVMSEGSITTFGDAGYGIVAQSIGGGGGNGGASSATTAAAGDKSVNLTATIGGSGGAAGDGGAVIVDNQGEINTWGDGAYGILAQSVGGGGGNGGTAKIETREENTDTNSIPSFLSQGSDTNPPSWSVNLGVGIGGGGGSGGDGGAVAINNSSNITTHGASAIGIFAQSVGGGGGSGGMSSVDNGGGDANIAVHLGLSLGGSGTNGGSGSAVTITNTGTIVTMGDNSHGIFAQSVGGGGGLGGDSAMASAAPGTNLQRSINLSLSLGESGSIGGDAGAVNVVQNGKIYTVGPNSYGILAQSIGGGGGAGGASASTPGGGAGNILQLTVGVGGKGGPGGYAGAVNISSSGGITTYGDDSYAILAQSIGGGGGLGGDTVTAAGSNSTLNLSIGIGGAGGNGNFGGTVTVTNSGDINTWGNNALGIVAQSIGGGGGRGGSASAQTNLSGGGNSLTLNVSVGGNGAGASDGGAVTVDNTGNIITAGTVSHGILAQSIGGGGGDGGYGGQSASDSSMSGADLQIVVGGKGGSGGNGDAVTINNSGYILTTNAGSFGILAQSIGGGGGIGGYGQPGALANLALGGGGGAGGNGGNVNVGVTGTIETFGAGAYGVFAQSVGGGGGIAGNVNHGISDAGVSLNLGQSGGAGGNGGDVTVISDGNIITHGDGAYGIFAQSVGGGGGLAGDIGNGLSFAGSVGGAGSGGTVHVIHTGTITTYGDNAYGIFAQSAGGDGVGGNVQIDYIGSINVYGSNSSAIYMQSRGDQAAESMTLTVTNGVILGGSGATAGIWFANGGMNTLNNYDIVTTVNGVAGNAIIGNTGNDNIFNDGVVIGSVDLGGGANVFYNNRDGRLNVGALLNLGAGNYFFNSGVLSPGGPGVLQTTALTGNFRQDTNGVMKVELGSASEYDRLAVSGTASLSGKLSVARHNNFVPKKGDQFAVLSAADGMAGRFTALDDPIKGNYALYLGTIYGPNQFNLIALQDSFVPFATTPNQHAVAENLDTFSGFMTTNQLQGDPRETNLIAFLDAVPGPQLPANFDLIAPEELGALYDMEFGSVDTMVGNIQSRMNDLRNGYASPSGSVSLFTPGGPVMQLASADRSLPRMEKARPNDDWSAFAGGYGQFIHVSSTANAPGYCLQNSGVTLDLDKPWDTGLMGGFTLDYAGGEASLANGGSANMEGGRAGLYGTWFGTNSYLEAQVGAGGCRYDSKRTALGGFAMGNTKGYEIDTMFGGGYDLKWNNLTAGVLAETHYIYVNIEGFAESGSMSPLQITENDSHSLQTLLGWRLAYDWRFKEAILRPELRLGWRHEFMDTTRMIGAQMASGSGSVFEVQSPSMGRDSISIVTGLSTRCSRHLSMFAYYNGELARDNATSHAVNGGISWDF